MQDKKFNFPNVTFTVWALDTWTMTVSHRENLGCAELDPFMLETLAKGKSTHTSVLVRCDQTGQVNAYLMLKPKDRPEEWLHVKPSNFTWHVDEKTGKVVKVKNG